MRDEINMLPGVAPYPLNQWYVAGFSREITRELSTRNILGMPVLLYRKEDGGPVALFDRCPHRGMPFSKGKLLGDVVQCGYHGMEFSPDGKCSHIPSGGKIPAAMCVSSYPVVEKWEWVWIWMGDPALADPDLIPDHDELGITRDGWFSEPGIHLHVKANYLLPFENLVDATHITYLHHGLIDTGNVALHPYELITEEHRVGTIRVFKNEPLPAMLTRVLGLAADVRVDRRLELWAYAPNIALVRIVLHSADNADIHLENNLVVALTPDGLTGTHQFAVMAANFPNPHPGRFDDLRNLLMEDVVVIEEIQQLFERLGENNAPEVSVRSDDIAIRFRRTLAGMIRSEQELAPGVAVGAM